MLTGFMKLFRLTRNAPSITTAMAVAVFFRENHRYAQDQGEHRCTDVVCLQHMTGLQVVPVSGERIINYPGVANGCTGHTEVGDNLAMA